MIFEYGFSVKGKSHIAKGICCQDAHRIKKMENGWYIAAIADGVGSAKKSQVGSRIAVDTVVEFCDKYMPWDFNVISIKSMMRTAYNYAFKRILEEAEKNNDNVESYDTTLSMVIFDGHRVIYGHSGDGAIIGLTTFGDYVEITRPQKGEDGVTVIPLRAGYKKWVIDTYDEELVSVLLMSDGMLDTLCPYLLKDLDNGIDKVYIPLGTFFADPKGVFESKEEIQYTIRSLEEFITADKNYNSDDFYARLSMIYKQHIHEKTDEIISDLRSNNYPVILMQNQQDDKTMVGLINTNNVLDDKNFEFYSEPDWQKLQEAWNRKAYPHLYKELADDDIEEGKENDNDIQKPEIDGMNLEEKEAVPGKIQHSQISDNKYEEDRSNITEKGNGKVHKKECFETDKKKSTRILREKETNERIKKNDPIAEETYSDELPPIIKHKKPRKKSFIEKIGEFWGW